MFFYISYDPETGEILQRRPSDLKYPTPVPAPYITVDRAAGYKSMDRHYAIDLKTRSLVYVPDKRPDERETALLEIARERTAGIEFRGHCIRTDMESRSSLTALAIYAMRHPGFETVWKTKDGFLKLDSAEVLELFDAVQSFVEESYIKEEKLNVSINDH